MNTVSRLTCTFKENVYILDDGFVIWIWIGHTSEQAVRDESETCATRYVTKSDRPQGLPIRQIQEGAEPTTFLDSFTDSKFTPCVIS